MVEPLWFDVEMIRYTTSRGTTRPTDELWFDVEMIRYTTKDLLTRASNGLWFDVEMIRYTTYMKKGIRSVSCGLM